MSNVISLFQKKVRKGEYGEGSVSYYKRDGIWATRVCIDGERHYLGGYATEEEGRRVIAAFWEDYDKQNIVGSRGQKLGVFGVTCLDERELEGDVTDIRSERSRWRVYVTGGTNKFKQAFEPDPIADVYVSELTSEAIREWVYRVIAKEGMHPHRPGGPRSANTVRRAYQVMRNVCARAFEKGLLSNNPAVGVKLPRTKKSRRERLAAGIEDKAPSTTYTEEELHRFWSCKEVPLAVRLWHAILVGTGMRAGEFADARIEDVHLDAEDPYLHLRDTKNGRPHDVRLFGVALRAVQRWLPMLPTYCKNNSDKLLWPGPHGGRRSKGHWWGKISVTKPGEEGESKQVDAFPIYLARAGITRHFRTHDTRHTCGTALVSGAWGPAWSLELVKEQFNHSDIRVTQRYAKAGETALKKAARETRGSHGATATRRGRSARVTANQTGSGASSGFERLAVNARNHSVGRPGLEPGTYGLKVRSSTD